jgi:uncharacterized protein YabN with tetrapyrrole methylase and pyrophosphatase domain
MTWSMAEMDVIRWSEARKIIPNSTSLAQWDKAQEEMEELREALVSRDREQIVDGLGDVLVCLINVSVLENLDLTACLKQAYEQIKDRRGYMDERGIFIKQA